MERKIYNNLLKWKSNNSNLPYMLIGVRQTGKTYIHTEFCKNEFENYIYLNLDSMEDIKKVFEETLIPDKIIQAIESILNINIDEENTIMFIDEIQCSERAISSLKYFAESEKNIKLYVQGAY